MNFAWFPLPINCILSPHFVEDRFWLDCFRYYGIKTALVRFGVVLCGVPWRAMVWLGFPSPNLQESDGKHSADNESGEHHQAHACLLVHRLDRENEDADQRQEEQRAGAQYVAKAAECGDDRLMRRRGLFRLRPPDQVRGFRREARNCSRPRDDVLDA